MKDIANRFKLLRGYRIHYFPGWDCHGMPIEQKALAEARADDRLLSALDVRNKGVSWFLPCDAMLVRYMLSSCVCTPVCLSQAGTVPKWLDIGSCKQCHTTFFGAKNLGEIPTMSLPIGLGAPNRGKGRFKLVIFDQHLAISQKRCKIGT